jgi:hypothetical protein
MNQMFIDNLVFEYHENNIFITNLRKEPLKFQLRFFRLLRDFADGIELINN